MEVAPCPAPRLACIPCKASGAVGAAQCQLCGGRGSFAVCGNCGGHGVAAACSACGSDSEALQRCVDEFNFRPARGLSSLRRAGLVGDDAESLAVFIRDTRGLDRTVVGDYLGGDKAFNRSVYCAFLETLDFAGLSLPKAMEVLFASMRLPGEAQKIDRMMEGFAAKFFRESQAGPGGQKVITCARLGDTVSCTRMSGEQVAQLEIPAGEQPFGEWLREAVIGAADLRGCEELVVVGADGDVVFTHREAAPSPFATVDAVFVVAFSLIMLQTEYHNPGIKRKMTRSEFCRGQRGVNDGGNLPEEFLLGLYDYAASSPPLFGEERRRPSFGRCNACGADGGKICAACGGSGRGCP